MNVARNELRYMTDGVCDFAVHSAEHGRVRKGKREMRNMTVHGWRGIVSAVGVAAAVSIAVAQEASKEDYVKAHYTKYEHRISMRDGKKLFTSVYVPKDTSQAHPILMDRTPYSVAPYGEDQYRRHLGPSEEFEKADYIFVYQDVRGRYLSEGEFLEMRPHIDVRKSPQDVDDSTDTYDTIEFLLKRVPNNNGKVGIWGISYPGFYTSASIIDSHPALKAASPQAPMTDLFMSDDAYHGGAFMLAANFGFYTSFKPFAEPALPPKERVPFDFGTPDGYEFYLQTGPIANLDKLYLKGSNPLFIDQLLHNTYDDYWKARDLSRHMKIFEYYLRGKGSGLPKAYVFETGTNVWRKYDVWPPAQAQAKTLYFRAGGKLSFEPPAEKEGFDEYVSDPARPVPFIDYISDSVPQRYMVDDQRFAARRPDVLVYETDPLAEDVTIAGPVSPKLKVASTGTDSDFVVKLIDVYPSDYPDEETAPGGKRILGPPAVHMGGYQQLLRGEPMRAKFRNSWEHPEALTPGKLTEVNFSMPDVNHTFRKGHRIMVQVQSSWFPLVDRNPQGFVDIPNAKPGDFKKATEQVFHGRDAASGVEVMLLPQ